MLGEDGAFASQARASGDADYRVKLDMPLEATDKAKLLATVALGGNELRLTADAPPLQQTRGTVTFTESGFARAGTQALIVTNTTVKPLYAQQLALAAGCHPDWAQDLLHAAPMHDIGKIGIPDAVLRKPGPLDADEWATMRRHPEIGVEIVG